MGEPDLSAEQKALLKAVGYTTNPQYPDRLKAYFDHFAREIGRGPRLEPEEVLYLIRLLKEQPTASRTTIETTLADQVRRIRCGPDGQPPPDIPTSLADRLLLGDQERRYRKASIKPAEALAVAVRVMLGLDFNVLGDDGFGTVTWDGDQSLEEAILDAFTDVGPEDASSAPPIPVRQRKLRARYLQDYAGVTLKWTDSLADHLLLRTDAPKTLFVFNCVALLEAAYSSMEPYLGKNMKLDQCLGRGCYQPEFLLETLMTYKLLFPVQDDRWLRNLIARGSRDHQSQLTTRTSLYPSDSRLTSPASMPIPSSRRYYDRPIKSCPELFKRYPHWATRLQIIFEEADDPTPVSPTDMWADRHKATRHSFWITFMAFAVAIAFGIVSTGLGAVQVYISYCAWRPENTGVCQGSSGNGTTT
ncbi:hypothetical protein QBC47DRAFT_387932 [Echria macrotheca]|uniref:Uncharacterized protein n=1 Tax=Echria macrotheca TaxID=438768 RepID=A0AAJ0B7L3_9PEZI|nr:hypothetical protein QBC47DRAFT_387932 [Echria macrotheca]